jgi:hypothetical protein
VDDFAIAKLVLSNQMVFALFAIDSLPRIVYTPAAPQGVMRRKFEKRSY